MISRGVAAVLLWAVPGVSAWAQVGNAELGAQLFDGRIGMSATIVGRDFALPSAASRCSNCHHLEARRRPAGSTAIGPALGPAVLSERRPRRGGPASAYDVSSFCRVLRTGVDPAHVVIDTRMPRFAATDAQCDALWSFLNPT